MALKHNVFYITIAIFYILNYYFITVFAFAIIS